MRKGLEAFKHICNLYISKQQDAYEQDNLDKAIILVEKALTPQHTTKEEIVKDLNELGKNEWEYTFNNNLHKFGIAEQLHPSITMLQGRVIWEGKYHQFPIELAHKITTFFIKEAQNERYF